MKNIANILNIIKSLILTTICTFIFINIKQKILIIPFFVIAITSLIRSILLILKNDRYDYILKVISDFSFITFWYGMLIFLTYLSIKEKNLILIIFSIPFWLMGFLPLKEYLKK